MIEMNQLEAYKNIYRINKDSRVKKWVRGILIFLLIVLFLPWTQNIRAKGVVTALRQEQRPQIMQNQIAGKIVKWFIKEGDFVKAGDTLVQIAEVKDDYLDPNIINRTKQQIEANKQKAGFYENKATVSENQAKVLEKSKQLKINQLNGKREQIERKITAKIAEVEAAKIDYSTAEYQIKRAKNMLDSGVISTIDFERRNVSFQKIKAALTDKENELKNLRQDLEINKIEIDGAIQEYNDKILKAQGDQFSSRTEIAATNEKVASLEIKTEILKQRSTYYFIIAPQDGQVVQVKKAGINEIIKENEALLEIVPDKPQYAVEMFVRPVDLPLLSVGQKVRFMFDGFPAIVFSGWPNTSYGTFGGRVSAVESSVNDEGKFRVLVIEDKDMRPWPKELKMGTGAEGMALLKDVFVWYELWRNINGFPPEYYKYSSKEEKKK